MVTVGRANDLLGSWDSKFGIDLVLGATKPEDVVLTRLGDRYASYHIMRGHVAQGSLVTRVGGISHANRTHLVSHRPTDSECHVLLM